MYGILGGTLISLIGKGQVPCLAESRKLLLVWLRWVPCLLVFRSSWVWLGVSRSEAFPRTRITKKKILCVRLWKGTCFCRRLLPSSFFFLLSSFFFLSFFFLLSSFFFLLSSFFFLLSSFFFLLSSFFFLLSPKFVPKIKIFVGK